jgi:hypothetical protein
VQRMRKDAIVLSPADKFIAMRGILDKQTPQAVSVSVPDGCLHVHGIRYCIVACPIFLSLMPVETFPKRTGRP